MSLKFSLRPQSAADTPLVLNLHQDAFGPGRFARTAFRIREASKAPPRIALTAWQGEHLAGAIHLTDILIGGEKGAMLLGPLAISSAYKSNGCGMLLMRAGMDEARRLGVKLIVLIGDLPYYQRAGFCSVAPGHLAFPGPVDPARILAAELEGGALMRFSGMITAVPLPAVA